MSQALLQLDFLSQEADLGTNDRGAISLDGGLETAVAISLFTDRRADDRRGWWGDSYPDAENDLIGSRLWTLERAGQTVETLRRAQVYAQEALQWMLTDGVAKRVSVTASWEHDLLVLRVQIVQPENSTWERVWKVHRAV